MVKKLSLNIPLLCHTFSNSILLCSFPAWGGGDAVLVADSKAFVMQSRINYVHIDQYSTGIFRCRIYCLNKQVVDWFPFFKMKNNIFSIPLLLLLVFQTKVGALPKDLMVFRDKFSTSLKYINKSSSFWHNKFIFELSSFFDHSSWYFHQISPFRPFLISPQINAFGYYFYVSFTRYYCSSFLIQFNLLAYFMKLSNFPIYIVSLLFDRLKPHTELCLNSPVQTHIWLMIIFILNMERDPTFLN